MKTFFDRQLLELEMAEKNLKEMLLDTDTCNPGLPYTDPSPASTTTDLNIQYLIYSTEVLTS